MFEAAGVIGVEKLGVAIDEDEARRLLGVALVTRASAGSRDAGISATDRGPRSGRTEESDDRT